MKLLGTESNTGEVSLIGRGVEITGDFKFSNVVQIDGKVVGNVISDTGTLRVGSSGFIEAQVNVDVCVVHGTVKGDLRAKSRVEIAKGGCVTGDVMTPVLRLEEGAVLIGAIKMGQDGANADAVESRPVVIENRKYKKDQKSV
jgi:cytoskeletal protein CcmA (bactofilin family)